MTRSIQKSLLLGALLFFLFPFFTHAENIDAFESVIKLSNDGSFEVTEKITYVFTDGRHGIFRFIPTEHAQKPSAWYKERYIDVEVLSVLMDGAPVPYEEEKSNDQILLTIGDPEVTISGTHVYEITYKVLGGLSYYPSAGAELYWDVTGTGWTLPIKRAEAVIIDNDGVLDEGRACFRGTEGLVGSCNAVTANGNTVIFTSNFLEPGEGMTIAHALDRTKVATTILERPFLIWVWIGGILVWFIFLIRFVYRYKTAYKTDRPVVAQYSPYKDFTPMYTGLLFDGALNPQDITACIVYLAREGYLKVRKVDKKVLFFFEVDDYEITLIKTVDAVVSEFQKDVVALLFGEEMQEGSVVSLSDLKGDLMKQKENHKILKRLRRDLEKDLEKSDFFEVTIPAYLAAGVPGLAVVVGIVAFTFMRPFFSEFTYVFIALLAVTIIVLAFMYRRRTRRGYEALDHLLGFKKFLSVTEEERYEFHNAPEKNPTSFMEFLPYAIAFGVEKEWAKVFEGITIPNPDWYEGGSSTSFSATNLSASLGAFSTAFTSSSGSSASSGGGSVGGGSGGGGGGSW